MKTAIAIASGACLYLAGAACHAKGQRSAEELLDALSPDDGSVERLTLLVEQLGSDEFRVREAAVEQLMAAPLVPAEVIKKALASEDPEIVSRVWRIVAKGGLDRSSAIFDEALRLIEKSGSEGLLPKIVAAFESGARPLDQAQAERAAGITATANDLALLRRLAGGEDSLSLRMAAAGAEAAGEAGKPLLRRLLKADTTDVRLRAGISLGNLGDPEGARSLGEFLNSQDTIARVRAWRALRDLTGKDFTFQPLDPAGERAAAAAAWIKWLAGDEVAIIGRTAGSPWRRLFDGRDLAGWEPHRGGQRLPAGQRTWFVEGDRLVCPGEGPGDLRTAEAFENYILLLRFRPPELRADSGIGIMLTPDGEKAAAGRLDGGSYLEVQLLPERSGDLYVIGGFDAQADGERIAFSHKRTADAGDAAGEWHDARLEVSGGRVKVFINGKLVNEASGGPAGPGKILLREESYRFEFKEISLLTLEE